MLLRLALFVVLAIFVARAFWRFVDRFVEGMGGPRRRGRSDEPTRGVQMVRDPVCGTFLLPDHALTIVDGRERVFFCSDSCRDKYQTRPSTGSGRPDPSTSSGSPRATSRGERAEGRTA